MGSCQEENQTAKSREKGTVTQSLKTDFIYSNYVWQGRYAKSQRIRHFRGHWQMAVGVRNPSARVYLHPNDYHNSVLCSQSQSVQAVEYGCLSLRKCMLAKLQKQQRVQNLPQHGLQSPEATQLYKLGQGLSWFRCNFLGSPEITLSDLTETQRKAFRVQVWLHQYCVNGLWSGQKDSRKAGGKLGSWDNCHTFWGGLLGWHFSICDGFKKKKYIDH